MEEGLQRNQCRIQKVAEILSQDHRSQQCPRSGEYRECGWRWVVGVNSVNRGIVHNVTFSDQNDNTKIITTILVMIIIYTRLIAVVCREFCFCVYREVLWHLDNEAAATGG